MIKAELINDRRVLVQLEAIPGAVGKALRAAIGRLAKELKTHVQSDYLSGQALQSRTGKLRRSIFYRVSAKRESVFATVGAEEFYGRFHERGASATFSVKAHLRTVKAAFGRPIAGGARTFLVRAHRSSIKLPERSFLAAALNDMADTIVAETKAEAHRALNS